MIVLLSVAVKDFVEHKPRTYVAKFTLRESRSVHLDSEQLPSLGGGAVLRSTLKYLYYFAFPQRRYIVEFRYFSFAVMHVLESSTS